MSGKRINDLLQEIYDVDHYEPKKQRDFRSVKDFNIYRTLVSFEMWEELGLLRQELGGTWAVSQKGKKIIESGGWLKHLDDERKKSEKSTRKQKWDYLYSKYRYFTYWWIFSFSLIGCGLGLYNFIEPRSNEESKVEAKSPIQQTEGEAAKQHISSSIPQISDSLHTANQKTDSLDNSTKSDSLPRK